MFKVFTTEIATVIRSRRGKRNLRALGRFFLILVLMITVYSLGFHLLMLREGQEYSWITGFYWTLTVMSTLGFGDITFHTDLGRLFSIVVLLSGTMFLLVLFPFTFIEFFYAPWMAAQAANRAPHQLPPEMKGHVLLTSYDAVSTALIARLQQYHYAYALIVSEVEEALRLHDLGINVVVGSLSDPETWDRVRVKAAAMVACTGSDIMNTNVAFTVRKLDDRIPIFTSAGDAVSVDILELAGSNFVLRLEKMMGESFALRARGGNTMSHVLGEFDSLKIAEATTYRTPLVGKTLKESDLRKQVGVTVIGLWERGNFIPAHPDSIIQENTVLLLAGSGKHLERYDKSFRGYLEEAKPVIIIGGGSVGQATAAALDARGIEYRIVEMEKTQILNKRRSIHGNAADLTILEKAGIHETSTVIITPNNDDLNVYLTIYCRQLRPEIQILCRTTRENQAAALHRAGADVVLSYASMGAGAAMNLLHGHRILMIGEGMDLFKLPIPDQLVGKTIIESSIREQTECSLVAIQIDGKSEINPDPAKPLPAKSEIVLAGTLKAEERFLEAFCRPSEAKNNT